MAFSEHSTTLAVSEWFIPLAFMVAVFAYTWVWTWVIRRFGRGGEPSGPPGGRVVQLHPRTDERARPAA